MIRVLLAEDQAMVRGALASLLGLEHDIVVVGEVGRGDEVVAAAATCRPDVALLDIEMPGMTGLDAAAALHAALPDCRVVILTTFGRPGYLRRAMEEGAAGFMLKDAPASELAAAIRRVVGGERIVDPGLAAAALSAGENPLTARERRCSPPAAPRARSPSWPARSTSPRHRPQPPPRRSWASSAPAAASRRSAERRSGGGCEPLLRGSSGYVPTARGRTVSHTRYRCGAGLGLGVSPMSARRVDRTVTP